ncbi:OmpA family protein [Sphingobacterium yanglingense]|uniref:Outer membrane protein OmpA-like peptidoglycan-associated protein n=1 Tax=Sphingobacterium yanglingense TaxID=1437280 RepID=A0A4R6WIP5_9SPHI|nr:OmpA family protein [Sphingobacterium yanglingense]TDQ80034.1 outer membrane protein OmpA-like peptidoglycan-associated protein [Sphingobacterium yanglingense]
MAHLEVKRKKRTGWLLWLLLVVVALIVMMMWIRGRGKDTVAAAAAVDSMADLVSDQAEVIAITEPDWNSVDFNAPAATDSEITDPDISIRQGTDYSIYTLGENILFPKDQKNIQSTSEAKLRAIATVLKKRFDGAYIGVYGSADSTGSLAHNRTLAADRANEVKNWLVDHGGIDYRKVSVHSIGERQPIASNETIEGRAQNRNVQIVVFEDATR